MKLITLNIPQPYLESLEDLVRAGFYPNRSEAIRLAVRDLIVSHWKKRTKSEGKSNININVILDISRMPQHLKEEWKETIEELRKMPNVQIIEG